MSAQMPTPFAMKKAREIVEEFRPRVHHEDCQDRLVQKRGPCSSGCSAHRIITLIALGLDEYAGEMPWEGTR